MPTSFPAAPFSISAIEQKQVLASLITRPLTPILHMSIRHLSVEQRFHLEVALREIDDCQDFGKLREVDKQITTAQ